MNLAILFPEHKQIDAGPLQLARQRRPVRLRPPAELDLHSGPGEKPLFADVPASSSNY
jgi:hypothetical protein